MKVLFNAVAANIKTNTLNIPTNNMNIVDFFSRLGICMQVSQYKWNAVVYYHYHYNSSYIVLLAIAFVISMYPDYFFYG